MSAEAATQIVTTLAVEPVGGMAGKKNQNCSRQKLNQSHHTEIKGAVGQRINLPADSNGGNLVGKTRKATAAEIKQKRFMAQQLPEPGTCRQ